MRNQPLLRRAPCTMALLALAGWPFSATVVLAQSPSRPESGVDAHIKPGDDFFAFANGAWLASTVIPKGRDRWAVRDEINERTRGQGVALLEDAASARAGSLARKVADFRVAYANQASIDARGVAPLAPLFQRIDRVNDKVALARLLGATMRADVDPLNVGVFVSASVLGLSVEHSIHGEKTYTPFLLQGGLGLGDRDKYLGETPGAVELRGRYRKYVGEVMSLAGLDHAARRADSVIALETAIARAHATMQAMAVDRNADNQWSPAELAQKAPGMDWSAFLDAAGLGKQRVIVAWQPSALAGIAALVGSQSLETWKDYLRVRAIDDHADVLPQRFADAAAALRGDNRTREQKGAAVTQSAMQDAIGELYARRYFSPAQKARIRGIVSNVTAAFREHVAHATWLSPASRRVALAKLDALYVGIGYPEQWDDFSDLRIDPADAFGNAERVAERNRRRALARLVLPFDRQEWSIAPQSVGGILNFQQNAYEFAAALLQPPKYDSTASDAATYGAIGALVAHDVSHFIDVLGADYEPDGRMRRWWTPSDSAGFEAAAEPLVRQFSEYEPLPGMHVDGRLTRGENVADLAGLTAAFDAHRKALGARASNWSAVRSADREFFIAFARTFATKMNETAMRAQLANDHAPEMYRFNTVRNIDAWYEAFDVMPGDRLYLAPAARVHVW
ncbi:MAG: M13 family metallopeptidase [Gemmatimonadaceae bacterium]